MLRDRDGKRRCGDTGALPQEMQEKCLWTLWEPLPLPCHCLGPHGTQHRSDLQKPRAEMHAQWFSGRLPTAVLTLPDLLSAPSFLGSTLPFLWPSIDIITIFLDLFSRKLMVILDFFF